MNSILERTLLTAFAAAHLDSGGDIQVREYLWTATYTQISPQDLKRTGFSCLHNDKVEGSWNDGEATAQHVLFICQHCRVKWDDVIFYPKDDDRTGVSWRMLKLDMPFLRIVLLKDQAALLAITRRLASIVSKALAEGLGVAKPKPELN